MLSTIIKFDIAGSKEFAASQEQLNPSIRKELLDKLFEIAKPVMPHADAAYPSGSYYRGQGDALYFVLEKPSVAVRSAIEFMQSWFNLTLGSGVDAPDCRVVLDRSNIELTTTPGQPELVGAAFETISVVEKGLPAGGVFATKEVVVACDRTMARFSFFKAVSERRTELFNVEFLNPRTVSDSSLLHALFVAHPKAEAARDRVLELFVLEYLLENGSLSDAADFNRWALTKGYPQLPQKRAVELCSASPNVSYQTSDGIRTYSLNNEGRELLARAKKEFELAVKACVDKVRAAIIEQTGTDKSIENIDLAGLIEEYLCAFFSEVRMMANYFRDTLHFMPHDKKVLAGFEYIIRKYVPFSDRRYFDVWSHGFVEGLRAVAEENNAYIAAVFHNVLATYYLNRSVAQAPYQLAKLSERRLYIDTNVLYAYLVAASEYHDSVRYFVERLRTLGIKLLVFPFTLAEYEASLAIVEREIKDGVASAFLIKWNPWLYQEFTLRKPSYLNSIAACRTIHSVTKGKPLVPSRYDEVDTHLGDVNCKLERNFELLDNEGVDELWADLRSYRASAKWTMDRYMDFIYDSTRSREKMAHDTNCVHNTAKIAELLGGMSLVQE